jgi:hypothetical protein
MMDALITLHKTNVDDKISDQLLTNGLVNACTMLDSTSPFARGFSRFYKSGRACWQNVPYN